MKRRLWSWCQQMLVGLATASLVIPTPVRAIENRPIGSVATNQQVTTDVALDANGNLKGIVLTSAGQPLGQTPVRIHRNGTPVAAITTDTHGEFTVEGLRGGAYQIETVSAQLPVRIWAPHTAPPSAARRAVVLVDSQDVVRAQGGGRFMQFMTNPWVLGGIVAAAIAIPLALDDRDAS
jgi:hypothetical protein